MEKIYIRKEITNFDSFSIFECTIDDVILKLTTFKNNMETLGWRNIELFNEYDNIYAYGERLETDGEYNKRIKQNAEKIKRQQIIIERERKKYEELKKKFENV